MAPDTGFKATQEILVLVGRAIDGLTPVGNQTALMPMACLSTRV